MAPVTEFVLAPIKPGAASLASLYQACSSLKPQTGSQQQQRVRAAVLHEDPTQLRLFADWDSVEDHLAFRAGPSYAAFMAAVRPHAAGRAVVLHAELAPHPPAVLDNEEGKGKTAVAEVLFAYFAPGAADAVADKNLAAARTLVAGLSGAGFAGLSGESAVGWSVERDVEYEGEGARVLVVLIGWDSVEAHREARATEAYGKIVADFQGAVEGLRGFDISHVTTKAM
ncbi:hypothetical protein F4820DRAFT_433683 [Hypoxylon rubiginosum]|uniref:Uncharacterized protein n=1 Tax=Hypoxylon rubiginosum TaxID=110542 RepID=A0ACB9YPY7_9PEZI|nr:hypothetical protein F4820DRAFT_433683 [Hypoxylon rubiginosum]